MSELEYNLAEMHGFQTDSIIVNGIGRSSDFLKKAIIKNSIVIIDSEQDFEKILNLRKEINKKIRLGIRLKVDVSNFSSSPYKSKYNKLGVFKNSELFKKFLKLVENDNVDFTLIHCHFTINELDPSIYLEVLKQIKEYLFDFKNDHPHLNIEMINIGGGFEVYDEKNESKFKHLFSSIWQFFQAHFEQYTLAIEPGRYLVSHAGLVKTKIIDKKTFENKTWIYVDAGANMLIPNPHARYLLAYPSVNLPSAEKYTISIGDGITSPAHVYADEVEVNTMPQVDDTLIFSNCGAYTDVYSSFWVENIYQLFFLRKNGELICTRSKEKISQLRKLFLAL